MNYKQNEEYETIEQYKKYLVELSNKRKEMVETNQAILMDFDIINSDIELISKYVLRLFDSYCDVFIMESSLFDVQKICEKLYNLYTTINKTYENLNISISSKYRDLRIYELIYVNKIREQEEFIKMNNIRKQKEEIMKLEELLNNKMTYSNLY